MELTNEKKFYNLEIATHITIRKGSYKSTLVSFAEVYRVGQGGWSPKKTKLTILSKAFENFQGKKFFGGIQ